MGNTLKKGSTELLILAILETRESHGYEISQQIQRQSAGVLSYHAASLYPLLYRLQNRGLIEGRWVEKAGQRRRRYYKLTETGKKMLHQKRDTWRQFSAAINHIVGVDNACLAPPVASRPPNCGSGP